MTYSIHSADVYIHNIPDTVNHANKKLLIKKLLVLYYTHLINKSHVCMNV